MSSAGPKLFWKRIQRYWTSFSLSLKFSGHSILWIFVASFCLCFVALRSSPNQRHFVFDHEEITPELHFLYHQHQKREAIASEGPQLILFWTKYHSSSTFDFGLGSSPFETAGCAVQLCRTTTDRSLLNESHAIIFHALDFNVSDLPTYRPPFQRWIFYTLTSPTNTPDDRNLWQVKFNWTMTYRRDSDIFQRHPYGSLEARPSLRTSYGKKVYKRAVQSLGIYGIQQKRKHVAVFTSTCNTSVLREKYIEELSRYIPVDSYGPCGQSCGTNEQCLVHLRKNYKFLLAFENSLCTDYVSEKMYVALENDLVPVVYGEADYSLFAPSNSYINARDFGSPKLLADYLWLLHRNDKLYKSFFSWKTDYQVERYPNDGWCQLCQMLHDPDIPAQSYPDIYDWWMEGSNCVPSYTSTNQTSKL